jgi:hypothetical protein
MKEDKSKVKEVEVEDVVVAMEDAADEAVGEERIISKIHSTGMKEAKTPIMLEGEEEEIIPDFPEEGMTNHKFNVIIAINLVTMRPNVEAILLKRR